jgi:RimJ/RimL family protein N-acetyltransferase
MSTEPSLRLAARSDVGTLFRWRNDPAIVALGTSQRTVTWEEHVAWFDRMLDNERHLLYVVYDGERAAGTVRVDRIESDTAVLAIYLMPPHTGRGLGPQAIRSAVASAFESWPELRRMIAHVRSDNIASLKAFGKAGFAAGYAYHDGPPGHVTLVSEQPTNPGDGDPER